MNTSFFFNEGRYLDLDCGIRITGGTGLLPVETAMQSVTTTTADRS